MKKGNINRIVYRVWQAVSGLCPRVGEDDRAEVRHWLNEEQMALWEQQAGRDRAHTMRVLRLLRDQGYTAPALMRAALLHDVGKIVGRPRLWHRTVWVLINALAPRLADRLVAPRGWRRPFWSLAEHPALGAEMARAAGCDDDTVWLIAHHQDESVNENGQRGLWLQALKQADQQT